MGWVSGELTEGVGDAVELPGSVVIRVRGRRCGGEANQEIGDPRTLARQRKSSGHRYVFTGRKARFGPSFRMSSTRSPRRTSPPVMTRA